MSSRKRKESAPMTQLQVRTQSAQQHLKKTKSKSYMFSFTQEEEENDVKWLDASQTIVDSVDDQTLCERAASSFTHISSGSAKSVLASTTASASSATRSSARRKNKELEKSASKGDAVLNLMHSLLESINVDSGMSPAPGLEGALTQVRESVARGHTDSQQVQPLLTHLIGPGSIASKSLDDFTEADFAMLELSVQARFGSTAPAAPSSSGKGASAPPRNSMGSSRPPLRAMDLNAWQSQAGAAIAPPPLKPSSSSQQSIPTQSRPAPASSTKQFPSSVPLSGGSGASALTQSQTRSQGPASAQKPSQALSQKVSQPIVRPSPVAKPALTSQTSATKSVVGAVHTRSSSNSSQAVAVQLQVPVPVPVSVPAVQSVEVVSADELAMWDQLERQATQAISRATIKPAHALKPALPSNSLLTDPRAPILCYKYSILTTESHAQGSNRMQRLYCCELNSPSATAIEPLQPCAVVDLVDDWADSALVAGDEILVVSLSSADVRAATKHVAGLKPASSNPSSSSSSSSSLALFVDTLPVPPSIQNPAALTRHRVDRDSGLLVARPRVLISPTRVAEACSCARRCVVGERVRSVFSSSSAAGVLGNLKHDFIETILAMFLEGSATTGSGSSSQAKRPLPKTPEDPLVKDMIKRCVRRNLVDLHSVGASDSGAELELKHAFVSTMKWARATLAQGYGSPAETARQYRLSSVLEAEETVWSPFLGLKGKLDVIARGSLSMSSVAAASSAPCLMPVELKTGKWKAAQSINHRAQVILYLLTLLLRERGTFVSGAGEASMPGNSIVTLPQSDELASMEGLLLYLGGEAEARVDVISPTWEEIKGLILSRNNLAKYLGTTKLSLDNGDKPCKSAGPLPLPPLLSDQRECTYCFQAAECMTYRAALEEGRPTVPGVQANLFDYSLRHTSPLHLSYLRHWESMLSLEEAEIDRDASFWLCDFDDNAGSSVQRLVLVWAQPAVREAQKQGFESRPLFSVVLEDREGRLLDKGQLGVSVGDCVTVSIEKEGRPKQTVTRQINGPGKELYTQTTATVGDLEDLFGGETQCYDASLPRDSVAKTRVFYACEPRVALGIVVSVDERRVTVETADSVKRLVQMSARGATVRLDISNVAVAVASMRACLLSLFVETHDPKAFQEWTKSHAEPTATNAVTVASTTRCAKLKQLVVDLSPPSFRPEEALGDGVLLFAPPHINRESFNHSLIMLQFYSTDIEAARKFFRDQARVAGSVGPHTSLPNLQSNRYVPAEEFLPGFSICITARGDVHLPDGLVVYPGCDPNDLFKEYQRCNAGQQLAIRRALCGEDYSLLHGYPGTGKSNVIALLVRCLVARGTRVMISAYTHSAVDNILAKLQASAMVPGTVLRIGAEESVQPSLQPFVVQHEALTSLQELSALVQHTRVVACTSLAAFRAPLVRSFDFDYCIIDEAGQMLEPVAIGALMMGRQFVLVGDPCQLPPLVVSPQARALGMDVSLFDRLAKAHPQAISSLTAQYRMNEDILCLCNSLFYQGAMVCGSPEVAASRLRLPNPSKIPTPCGSLANRSGQMVNWVLECVRPDRPVIFLDTDKLNPLDSATTSASSKTVSAEEAEAVRILVRAFAVCGVNIGEAVGVVTPFRAQIKAISTALKNRVSGSSSSSDPVCEVSTVDRYQGRDKEIVLFSTSTTGGKMAQALATSDDGARRVGEILTDWRRLNVAVSRARSKLVIVGSTSSLKASQAPALVDLVALLEKRGCVLSLVPDALLQFSHV